MGGAGGSNKEKQRTRRRGLSAYNGLWDEIDDDGEEKEEEEEEVLPSVRPRRKGPRGGPKLSSMKRKEVFGCVRLII